MNLNQGTLGDAKTEPRAGQNGKTGQGRNHEERNYQDRTGMDPKRYNVIRWSLGDRQAEKISRGSREVKRKL